MMILLLTLLYVSSALLLALYTSGQLVLLLVYWRHRCWQPELPVVDVWPSVTVQLPVYNERHVILRLLRAAARLDYPADRLIIQILDDSTDSTSQLVASQVARLRRGGLNVQHIRRPVRSGYKAGALAYGTAHTESEILAVFDADFVPPADFLKRTVPYMAADPGLGIVQTRWGHLNSEENWLTRAQALSVDAHFVVEQTARNRAGWLLTFNGTGGLWRRQCIEEAGGWDDSTLTEDLDLSYRAQLAGWRYLFLPDLAVPGELPPQLTAYKQQQARWAQGSTQCLLKLSGLVWRSQLSTAQRVMAMQHLCQYLPHPLMLILLLLTPLLILSGVIQQLPLAPLGLIGAAPPLLYIIGQRRLYANWKARMLAFPYLMLLGTGIIWNNTAAVIAALSGKNGEFRRTPKFAHGWQFSHYALPSSRLNRVEGLLAVYALWGAGVALSQAPSLAPYMALYSLALGMMVAREQAENWQLRRHQARRDKVRKSARTAPQRR